MRTLAPHEFRTLMQQPQAYLLDVRLPDEVAHVALPNAVNIPLHELAAHAGEIPQNRAIAIYCHHGVRSAQAGWMLERLGHRDVSHLEGGIHAWADTIDPTLPRY